MNTKNNLMSEMQPFAWSIVTFMLIGAGLFLRLYHLTNQSLWLDEALCVKIAATETFSEMLRAVTHDIHPPLFYILLHFWILLFNNSDFSVRMFSVVWGCIGLFGVYFICRYGLNWTQKSSTVATLFAVILPIHIYYSQEVRPYTMLFALSCFALSFLFRAHSRMKARFYLLFGLFQSLILYVHHTGIIYCFFINTLYFVIILLYKEVNWQRLRGLFLSGLFSFLLYLPWLPLLLGQFENPVIFKGFWYWVPQPSPVGFLKTLAKIVGVWKLGLPFNVPDVVYLLLILPLLILLFCGLLYSWRKKGIGESILAGAILGYPLFICFLSYMILPVWLIRILIPSSIGVPIIAALGTQINFLSRKHNGLLGVLMILYVTINCSISLNVLHTYQKENWREAASILSHSVRNGDCILVYRDYYAVPLERYIKPEIHIKRVYVIRESSNEDLPNKLAEQVIDLGENAERIFLVLAGQEVPPGKLAPLMTKDYMLSEQISLYGLKILVFESSVKGQNTGSNARLEVG